MGSDPFQIDESRWPIVVLKLRGTLTMDDYRELMDRSEAINSRGQPHVGVVDLRELVSVADAAQRKFIAMRIREMEQKYGQVSIGTVMIVKSALIRGALTAVEWLRGRRQRDVWVGSMDEALDAATHICRDHGLVPSAPASRHA